MSAPSPEHPLPRTAAPALVSVVAPVYNESAIVEELVNRLASACRLVDCPFEVVIVNDGSRDGTLGKLVAMSRDVSELRVIDLARNSGHMSALHAGVRAARRARGLRARLRPRVQR